MHAGCVWSMWPASSIASWSQEHRCISFWLGIRAVGWLCVVVYVYICMCWYGRRSLLRLCAVVLCSPHTIGSGAEDTAAVLVVDLLFTLLPLLIADVFVVVLYSWFSTLQCLMSGCGRMCVEYREQGGWHADWIGSC